MSYLYLFQIGPVQSFIAAARRTQDLYVGSCLLSKLAETGVLAALAYEQRGVKFIFPFIEKEQTGQFKLPPSIPHRFAFIAPFSPSEKAANKHEKVFPEHIVSAIRNYWIKVINTVGDWLIKNEGQNHWTYMYGNQAAQWLDIYWVAVPYEANKHAEKFKFANAAMAQRKQAATFPQAIPSLDEEEQKCTVSGIQAAIPLNLDVLRKNIGDNKYIQLRRNERLGSVALIKRFIQSADPELLGGKKFFPDTHYIARGISEEDAKEDNDPAFFAVLHMDGDKMGQRLSSLDTLEKHQSFSEQLAKFAAKAEAIIEEQNRKHPYSQPRNALVYVGGDDVLALLTLEDALPIAQELQQAFEEFVGVLKVKVINADGEEEEKIIASASCGIAITPYKLPLDGALAEARLAEHAAKESHSRHAIVVREAHRSGLIREAGGKWDILQYATALQDQYQAKTLSGKFGFDLLEIVNELADGIVPNEALLAETERIYKRRLADKLSKKDKADLAKDLATAAKDLSAQNGWEQLANWAIVARFIAEKQKNDSSKT